MAEPSRPSAGSEEQVASSWTVLGLVIAGAALMGGLGEYSIILAARVLLDRYTLLNPQGVWLTPLINAVVFAAPVGLAWWLGQWRGGRQGAVRWGVFVAGALAALEVFTIVKDRLHILAFLALAGGIGAQAASIAAADVGRFVRLGRRVVMSLMLISITGGIGFNVWRARREGRAVTSGTPAAIDAPSVIILVLDTVRALSLSAYGYGRPTSPFLAELASRGVLFDRAFSPAPWTLPSHASLFTGRDPHELSSSWSVPLDDQHPTLAEVMAQRGYLTAGFAANLRYVSHEFGLSRGFGYYRDYDVSVSEALRSSGLTREVVGYLAAKANRNPGLGRQRAARVFERFLAWHRSVGDRPYFAFLNVYDAHAPYAPDAPFDTLYLGRQARARSPEEEDMGADERGDLQAAYDASITWLDHQIRGLFEELGRRGGLENTLVIVTSDHGEEFGEHGYLNHGSTLYLPSVHVPLIMVQPGRLPAGTRVPDLVSLRDVPSTVLAQTGGSTGALPGVPLFAADGTPSRQHSPVVNELDFARNLPGHLPVAQGDMKAVFDTSLRYILNGDGSGELYDVLRDPGERLNLVSDSAHLERRESLRARARAIPQRPRDR